MDRITAIRKSLRAFGCGIIGFLPFAGVIPAIYALACWASVRSGFRGQWNPASDYLNWGAALALFGLLCTGLILIIAALGLAFSAFE
jgi:hypothetical protein